MNIKQAALLMEISMRYTKRPLTKYRQAGARALAHGNRGHSPFNKIGGSIGEPGSIAMLAGGVKDTREFFIPF